MNLLKVNDTIINLDNITKVQMIKKETLRINFGAEKSITLFKDEAEKVFNKLTEMATIVEAEGNNIKAENTKAVLKSLGGQK